MFLENREQLAQLPASESQNQAGQTLSTRMQDQIIVSTLLAVGDSPHMTDATIWDRIKQLAENDPSPSVRVTAKGLVAKHNGADSTP